MSYGKARCGKELATADRTLATVFLRVLSGSGLVRRAGERLGLARRGKARANVAAMELATVSLSMQTVHQLT